MGKINGCPLFLSRSAISPMTLETVVSNYGYFALLVGTFLEGETILILAGIAAHLGYLSLPWVIFVAFLGTILGDQAFFYLGRRTSKTGSILPARWARWGNRIRKVQTLMENHRTFILLTFRFLYGLRSITPFVFGLGRIPVPKFLVFNLVSAVLWATTVGIGGYIFGNALEIFFGDLKKVEYKLFCLIALTGGIIWGIHFYHARRRPS